MQKTVVLHTPCLEAGIYPRCANAKGKCELEGLAKQVWDRDHIIEMCRTPSLIVAADKIGQPIRPLKIFGVADETVNLDCLECGDSGGACAYLCIDKAKEIK